MQKQLSTANYYSGAATECMSERCRNSESEQGEVRAERWISFVNEHPDQLLASAAIVTLLHET